MPVGARAAVRRTLYPTLEAIWGGGFALAGRLSRARSRVEGWSATGGAPVLIIATHPDDETSGCGGAACLHRGAGDPVHVLVLTDGRASRAGGLEPAAMAALRAGEVRRAAGALGVADLALVGLPEGEWTLHEGTAAIKSALAARPPALVYAPSPVDYHPEHVRTARACALALRTLGPQAPLVRGYETFVPLGELVNLVADISPVARSKDAALACYTSQQRGLSQVARRDRYLARLYGVGRAAEAFCELTAADYSWLVEAATPTNHDSPFRGLRGRPFTDPLAYLVGRRSRRRLRTGLG